MNDPKEILAELQSNDSVLITEHNYAPEFDQTATSGKFCVQFVTFNNNSNGMSILNDWFRDCLDNCSLDPENGVCGDQKYLDYWSKKYTGVVISSRQGAGVAPWNATKFEYLKNGVSLKIRTNESNTENIIFYHFHALKIYLNGFVEPTGRGYKIPKFVYENIYQPYFDMLISVKSETEKNGFSVNHGARISEISFDSFKTKFKKNIKRTKNVLKSNYNFPISKPELIGSSCPICDSNNVFCLSQSMFDDRYGYPGFFMRILCGDCNHQFLVNNFSNQDLIDLYTNYYPRKKFLIEDFRAAEFKRNFSGWLVGEKSSAVAWIPKNTKVLDIGCGLGESVIYHKNRGCFSVGVEADKNVQQIAKHYDLDIREGIFSKTLFGESEKFTYITLDQVLEHSPNPIKTIEDAEKLLALDGQIVLTIPNASGWGAKVFGRAWINWHTPYHLHFFSKSSLQKLLHNSQLEIKRTTYCTHSSWLYYQMLHLFEARQEGQPSKFWGGKGTNKFLLKVLNLMVKAHVFNLITRFFDSIKLGDNLIVCIRRKEE